MLFIIPAALASSQNSDPWKKVIRVYTRNPVNFYKLEIILYIYSDQYLNPNLTFEDIRTKKKFQFQVKMKMLFPKWLFL